MTEAEKKEAFEKWKEERYKRQKDYLNALPAELKGFVEGNESELYQMFRTQVNNGVTLSDFVRQNMSELFEGYIRPDLKDSFLWATDNFTSWQYSTSYWRRSYRTSDESAYLYRLKDLISNFATISNFDNACIDLMRRNVGEMELMQLEVSTYWSDAPYEYILAKMLDENDSQALKIVEDMIMGEGTQINTGFIRGILRSKNHAAHELLGKLLLAAKLQEGVRQAICENADCGTAEGFLHILDLIIENDLIRFSSVKRAAATWCGLFADDPNNLDRIAKKSVKLMYECLNDEKAREKYLSSEDAMEIYIALWGYSFRDALVGVEVCRKLVMNGSRHRRMVCATFVKSLDNLNFENECGKFAIENFREENDTAALFMSALMPITDRLIYSAASRTMPGQWSTVKPEGKRLHTELDEYFASREEAYKFYEILKELRETVPKKEIKFEQCVFPWNTAVLSKSDIVERMAYIASALHDNELMDEMCALIGEVGDYRANVLILLTAYPETVTQQNAVVAAIADRESSTAETAYRIVEKSVKLTSENYDQLEKMLKYKSANIRKNVITLLLKQDDESLLGSCERLLSDKSSEKRTGGLDIVMQIKKDNERTELFEKLVPLVEAMSRDVSKEKILIEEILGDEDPQAQEGYGLYTNEEDKLPEVDKKFVKECRELFGRVFPEGCLGKGKKPKGEPDHVTAIKKLEALIDEHANDEFINHWGETVLLGNEGWLETSDGKLAFEELWMGFYDKEIHSPELLIRMYMNLCAYENLATCVVFKSRSDKTAAKLLGESVTIGTKFKYHHQIANILLALSGRTTHEKNSPDLKKVDAETWLKLAVAVGGQLLELDDDEFIIDFTGDETEKRPYYATNTPIEGSRLVHHHPQLAAILNCLNWNKNDEMFKNIFALRCALVKKANFTAHYHYFDERTTNLSGIMISDAIKACAMGLISDSTLYKWIFEQKLYKADEIACLSDNLERLSSYIKFIRERDKVVASRRWYSRVTRTGTDLISKAKADGDEELDDSDRKVLDKAGEVYEKVVNVVLETELKRGDSETVFSKSIDGIKRIYGAKNFVRILEAMGKDAFDRSAYFTNTETKKGALSHLISVCVPDESDSADTLRELVKNTDITEKRLIEAAMYSAEWIDIVEEYLGWEGFRSGCYYFMAHMNDYFDEKRMAVIAKYTPLSKEELQQGAFDINWFKEAHSQLGEKRFAILYDAAKYISDGAKHSRARKYADAAMGKLDEKECEQTIDDKRNKDLLMAYSLIPIGGEDDVMRRYLFLQKFLKESKQFGAQRRASEAAAVDIGMRNLATAAGLSDVTRLKLRMETRFFESIRGQFEPHEIGEVKVWLEVSQGKTELKCEKGGKVLKSVPAKLKKDEYIVSLTETKKQLTEQYRRTRLMLEQAMEDEGVFTLGEINMLKTNPVAAALTEDLVFNADGKCLLVRDGALVDVRGEKFSTDESLEIKIAHPIDMYCEGTWREYQKYLFDNKLVQPFRQVFRELYIKTDEELECFDTRRYAGNQIQVKKTIATLKSRRWVCDVEEGLQKVYFKENLVAKLYALADWFSPSDIEAPTLEWVGFSDRKTGKPVRIKDIPDIIFSEVMRDADLAVSVCHAGEVDPEHSHSTIEMRAAILEFTLPLFKLDNCEISGTHVIIKGSRADYSVHLGSGVCHILGGAMINILPVHSQQRGRIFLPFADDDPKTAEVISKVLLLAEDKKIKDPYILSQIGG